MENYEQNQSTMHYDPNFVPEEVKGWNWGAFVFNIGWGIGNKAYLALLCLIPGLNIIWVFVCGAKGNEWAWKSGQYQDVATFKAVQETWNRAGLVMFGINIALMLIMLFFMVIMFAALSAMPY